MRSCEIWLTHLNYVIWLVFNTLPNKVLDLNCEFVHRNENVSILTKFSSLVALEVVILTTSSATTDENF